MDNMDDILDLALLDSDDDGDVDDLFALQIINDNLGHRGNLYGRFSLENMLDREVKQLFRFQKQDIRRLARGLGIPEEVATRENITLSGVHALCILLRRLTYPNRLADLETIFGYSYGALSSIVSTVSEIIITNKGHLLQNLGNNVWLNENKLRQYSESINLKGAPMNNLWAFIDGTIRPICRPSINQRQYYSGHKRTHCVKYQSLLCPDGIVISLKGAYPGARHDAGIFRESGLYDELEEFTVFGQRQYVIYGDQGYGLRELLIRPFSQNEIINHPERQNFNNIMSVLRVSVEWGFGKILQQFAFLDFKKNQKLLLQEVGAMYSVGMLLTNCHTCLYGSQESVYFNIEPPILEVYLGGNYQN